MPAGRAHPMCAAGPDVRGRRRYVLPRRFVADCTAAFSSHLMAMTPWLVVYVFAQRWVISGLTRGAIT
jgi:ABC-type glycerol-3-phosphate transport system permease component